MNLEDNRARTVDEKRLRSSHAVTIKGFDALKRVILVDIEGTKYHVMEVIIIVDMVTCYFIGLSLFALNESHFLSIVESLEVY